MRFCIFEGCSLSLFGIQNKTAAVLWHVTASGSSRFIIGSLSRLLLFASEIA